MLFSGGKLHVCYCGTRHLWVYNDVFICSLYKTEPAEPSRYMDDILCADTVNVVYDALFAAAKDYTLDSRGDVGAGYVQSTHVSCSPPRITPWTAGVMLGQGTYKVLMYHVLHQGLHPGQQWRCWGRVRTESTHVSCSPPRITPWTVGVKLGQGTYKVLMYHVLHQGLHHGQQGRCWGRVRTKYSCIMFSTKDYTLDSRGDVGAGYVQSTHVSCSPPRITPWTVGTMLGQGTYKVLMYHVLHQGLHPGQQGDVGAGYVQSTHVSCSPPRITPWTVGAMLGQGTYKVLMYHVLHQGLHPGQQGDVGAGYVQSTHVSCSPPRITPWTARVMLGQGTYKVLMYHVLHQGLHPGQQG